MPTSTVSTVTRRLVRGWLWAAILGIATLMGGVAILEPEVIGSASHIGSALVGLGAVGVHYAGYLRGRRDYKATGAART